MKRDATATDLVREHHAAGVKRLNEFFQYDPVKVLHAPKQIGWSRKMREAWEPKKPKGAK